MRALLARLPELREEHRPDVVVVNAENAAAGAGTSPRQARDLLDAGVDVLTGGNHTLQKPEIHPMLEAEPRMLRPANIAVQRARAAGMTTVETAGGPGERRQRHGLGLPDRRPQPVRGHRRPGRARRAARADVVLVDIHAEATSEKIALAHHLDRPRHRRRRARTPTSRRPTRGSCGGGTAYVTDLGMTGPHDSVIGVRTEIVLRRFLTGAPGALRAGRRRRAGAGRGGGRGRRRPRDRDLHLQHRGVSRPAHAPGRVSATGRAAPR